MKSRAVGDEVIAANIRTPMPTALRNPRLQPVPAITLVVGRNLRRLRAQRGLSLEGLARFSGVSRAMLGQVELGKTTPSIHVVWKIARSLGVTFSMLVEGLEETRPTVMRAATAKLVKSGDGAVTARTLSPDGGRRSVEFYEVCINPRSVERSEPHAPGTRENLVVLSGSLGIVVAGDLHHLTAGDAIEFQGDVAHEYSNLGDDLLRIYVVLTYPFDAGSSRVDGC